LQLQQHSNEKGLAELDEWARANEQAQEDALKAAVKLLTAGVAESLEKRAASARSFKGWLTRYEKAVKENGVPFEALQDKIETATRGYANASLHVAAGGIIKDGLLANDSWNMVKHEFGTVTDLQGKADASIREVLNDPDLRKLMTPDHPFVEFSTSLFEMLGQSEELKKVIGPETDLASFVVAYGYNGVKWWESRNLILQQDNLTDQELQAVAALKKQIQSTTQRLTACRASAATPGQ
jgi:hypothetical protein